MIGGSVGFPGAKRLLRARQSAPLASNILGSAFLTRRTIWGGGCFTEPVQVKPAAVQVGSSSLAAEIRRDQPPPTFCGFRPRQPLFFLGNLLKRHCPPSLWDQSKRADKSKSFLKPHFWGL